MKRFLYTILFSLLAISAAMPQSGIDKQYASIKSYISSDKVHAGSTVKLAVKTTVEKGWHINSNKPKDDFLIATELTAASDKNIASLTTVTYPKAQDVTLGFSDKPVSVFEGEVIIQGTIKISDAAQPGEYTIVVNLGYQSCNNATCMPPKDVKDTIHITIVDKSVAESNINQDVFTKLSTPSDAKDNGSLSDKLQSSSIWLSLLLVFLGGLALNLTPCVYPLIPVTIGFFGGQSEGSTKRLAMMGFLYLIGIAITYSVVGVVTALSGAIFGSLMQSPFVIIAIVAVLIALSLSMFGVYEFKLPDSLMQKAGDTKSGLFGAFFMGLTMGIVAAPCIGPFVLGLVTYVAAIGDPLKGFLLFFFLALGLGTPYFVLALFSGKIKKLPRSGMWMDAVKHIFGFVLLGMALYFALPLFPKTIAGFLLPVYMLITGAYLLIFEKAGNNLKGFKTFRIVFSIAVIIAAVVLLIPNKEKSIEWSKYSPSEYSSALGKTPMIIDFYADWCIPCKELDKETFSDDNVIKESKQFKALKADMTKSVSPEVEKLRNEFKIVGVPTVLIIDASGKEVARITGFVKPQEFLKVLETAK
jgi:thiol:disulfide interchange protein DsbD